MNELANQEIIDYKLWGGIYLPSIKASINAGHKQIIADAYENDLPEVCVAEDDIKFFGKGAWQYYLDNKPEDFDIYLGMFFMGDPNERNELTYFNGMTLYTVSKNFYPTFLTLPNDEHIDRALAGKGKYVCCPKFVCTQYDGFSANTGKEETYENLIQGRNLFNG